MDGKQRSVKPIMPSKPFKPAARLKRAKGSTNRDDGAGVRLAMTVICIIAVVMVTVYFIGAQISPASGKMPDGNGGAAGGGAADPGTEYDDAETVDAPGTDAPDEAEDTGADTDFKVYISFDIVPDTADDTTADAPTDTPAAETDGDVTGEANITDDTAAADTAEPETPAAPMEPEAPGEQLPEDHIFLNDPEGKFHDHILTKRTCTERSYCLICGESFGAPPLGHKWHEATCTKPRTCTVCGETEGEPLGHDWREANCVSAKTCKRCGEQEGEISDKHDWRDATCTKPKTCSVCGATEGEPLGHKWRDATCTEAKKCTRCGKTSGKALGHQWKDATTKAPKTCTVCGATTGDRLPDASAGGPYPHTDEEYELLARLVYIEAGGESYDAMLAVATVVVNRARASGITIHDAIYAPNQFATGRIDKVSPTSSCYRAAKSALDGNAYDKSIRYFRNASAGKNWGSRKYCFTIDGIAFFS